MLKPGPMQELADRGRALDGRLAELAARGVQIVDPRQTYVDEAVRPERIHAGVILHPGARVCGARSFLGPGAELGREGPVTAIDCVLGEGARLDGGYASGAVLLRGASTGSANHVREGTLLEEEASTAHAVGLKHTILLSFVTIGSLVNFCDALVAGGTSRQDHSEIGSGYIHFNFTPWGVRGDKATPSLVGDVARGVLLRERRIFLGGSGGMVGPRQVGYGAIAGAGQVLRKDVPSDRLVVQPARAADQPLTPGHLDGLAPRAARNARYLGELHALRAWYAEVRLRRAPGTGPQGHVRTVIQEAIATIDLCIAEREARLAAFLRERGVGEPPPRPRQTHACPLAPAADTTDHVAWVRGLAEAEVAALAGWLAGIVADVAGQLGMTG